MIRKYVRLLKGRTEVKIMMKKKSDTLMNTKGKIMKFRISSRKIKNDSDFASGK